MYDGRPGKTGTETFHYSCHCGAVFPVTVVRAVNAATDWELAEAAGNDVLNMAQCPYCNRTVALAVPFTFHHPHEERFV